MNSASLRRTTVGKTLLLCVALAVLFALVYVARDGLAPPTVVSKSDSAQIIAPPVLQPLPPAPAHYRVNGAANLSPPRDASPLRVSPGKPLARKDMKCWDHLSRPTAAPSWADSLFRAIGDTGTYNALRDAVEQDPWTILLAWVPAYMWTVGYRERNHTGLLQDYNASWYYAPPDQRQRALPIVYQLGHRNALAVCARERINLLARRCSVDGLPPILVHSCLCPECEESLEGDPGHEDRLPGHATADAGAFAFLPAATQRLPAVQKYRSTAPRVPPAKAPVPPAGWTPHDPKCVSAFCAPWLVSRDVVPAFSYEGLSSDLPTLLSRVADVNGDVMVVLFNAAWVDHVYNWVFSMCHRAGQMRPRYIVATMDAPSLELCISLRLPCFDVVPFMYSTEAGADGDAHKRKVSNTIGWIKPRLALEILDLGYGFWMADLDMTWNHAPDAYMPPMEPNLLMHQCDQPVRLQLNSGFYLVRPSLAAWLYFTNMMTFSPEEMNDQNAMRFWTRSDRTHQLRTKCLDSRVFDMKCNYIVPHSRVPAADGKSLLRWSPIERDRTKFTWSIHHGTCLDGSDAKIKYFRTMNMWFVDDLDAMTVPGQPFCWRVGEPGAEKRVNVTLGATSKHSSMYPTGGDQKYLLEMH